MFTNDRKETTFCILVGQTGVQTLTQVDRLNELQKRCSEPFPVMSSLPPQTAAGMGGFEPVIRVCSKINMKGEAQFQTGEVWEEGLRHRRRHVPAVRFVIDVAA